MSTIAQRSSKSGKQSLFFRDLASPISVQKGRFTNPGQAAAVSALWRENFGGADLPPPPVFTLEDRADFSPDSGIGDLPSSPDFKSRDYLSPLKGKLSFGGGVEGASSSPYSINAAEHTPVSSSWWSPPAPKSVGDEKGTGRSSPVDGVVQTTPSSGGLLMLPPPREVAGPDLQRNSSVPAGGNLDEEEWVTVYGFSPGDMNLVLREFEKCGVILKHVPGPGDANWVHILYQNRFDAQKALGKNGLQMNSVLIVGVKPLDAIHRRSLNEKLNNQGFMVLPPQSAGRSSALSPLKASPRPYYPQTSDSNRRAVGAIASPAKSFVSKVTDLIFGV